ncbi:MAG TPA: sulfotransferase [Kiloniellales bacterium]|nr:sulfotransferase [Kiloniellales bacterium]
MAKVSGAVRLLFHPLAGADLATLLWLLRHGGGVTAGGWSRTALLASAVGRLPFTLGERAWVAFRRRGRDLETPPLFVLGHWRSGTTHLLNVLAQGGFGYTDPMAAGMPLDFLFLGRLLRPLMARALPRNRLIDAVEVTSMSPQEDEMGLACMVSLSYLHAIYFPSRFQPWFNRGLFFDGAGSREVAQWERRFRTYLWKTARWRPDKPLLVKNPVYTGRVAQLERLYPQARYLHIVRNPHEVFASSRSLFARMLELVALQPWDHVRIEDVVLATYARMMDRLIADMATLPRSRFFEVRFEDLEAQPLVELERIHDGLGLGSFAAARPTYAAYLDSVRDYQRAKRSFPERDLALVERHWGRFLDHWGYGRP